MTFASLFGERLKHARKAMGWSQAEAAENAGVSREYWGRCERGASIPGGEVLAALAQHGVDVQYVLTGDHSVSAAQDAAEQVLLNNYRSCSLRARQHLIQTSALLAAGVAPAADGESVPKKPGDAAQKQAPGPAPRVGAPVFHDQVGQQVSVAGNFTQKSPRFFDSGSGRSGKK